MCEIKVVPSDGNVPRQSPVYLCARQSQYEPEKKEAMQTLHAVGSSTRLDIQRRRLLPRASQHPRHYRELHPRALQPVCSETCQVSW